MNDTVSFTPPLQQLSSVQTSISPIVQMEKLMPRGGSSTRVKKSESQIQLQRWSPGDPALVCFQGARGLTGHLPGDVSTGRAPEYSSSALRTLCFPFFLPASSPEWASRTSQARWSQHPLRFFQGASYHGTFFWPPPPASVLAPCPERQFCVWLRAVCRSPSCPLQ